MYTCNLTRCSEFKYIMCVCVCVCVVLPLELTANRGGRVEKTTTSKGLMHSSDHIKETMPWGEHPLSPLGESLVCVCVCVSHCMLLLPFSTAGFSYFWRRQEALVACGVSVSGCLAAP